MIKIKKLIFIADIPPFSPPPSPLSPPFYNKNLHSITHVWTNTDTRGGGREGVVCPIMASEFK